MSRLLVLVGVLVAIVIMTIAMYVDPSDSDHHRNQSRLGTELLQKMKRQDEKLDDLVRRLEEIASAGGVLVSNAVSQRTDNQVARSDPAPCTAAVASCNSSHVSHLVRPQNILMFITSFDRGAFARGYDGDKLDLIKKIVMQARLMCEFGHQITLAYIAAWKISAELDQLSKLSFCQRTKKPVPVLTVKEFPPSIEGNLSFQHRLVIQQQINNFNFFIQTEDDMVVTLHNVNSHLRHTELLRAAGFPPDHKHVYPGFLRYEFLNHDRYLFEANEDMSTQKLLDIPGAGLYVMQVGGNVHQAMWMGTREQVVALNKTCNQPFLAEPFGPWVEFWSGGMQIFFFCERWKVIPVADFEAHLVHHASDSKLKIGTKGLLLEQYLAEVLTKPKESPRMHVNGIKGNRPRTPDW